MSPGDPRFGDLARFPERPPSEVEWEELLVKYELTPRALRVALADAEDAGAGPELRGALRALLEAELHASLLLDAMREGRRIEDRPALQEVEGAMEMAERFAGLRGRNFAAVQRRGIDVWEWATEHAGTRVTPYRLLLASVVRDGRALARVREAARGART